MIITKTHGIDAEQPVAIKDKIFVEAEYSGVTGSATLVNVTKGSLVIWDVFSDIGSVGQDCRGLRVQICPTGAATDFTVNIAGIICESQTRHSRAMRSGRVLVQIYGFFSGALVRTDANALAPGMAMIPSALTAGRLDAAGGTLSATIVAKQVAWALDTILGGTTTTTDVFVSCMR